MMSFLDNFDFSIEFIIALLILFVDVVIFIITLVKKSKSVASVYEVIDSAIPFMIKKAEEEYPVGFGELKKELVIKAVCGLLLDKFGITDYSRYLKYIGNHIELILSTPQRKEK